jgi:nitrite reductase/ring-hydroxylating ferredoxin subunit
MKRLKEEVRKGKQLENKAKELRNVMSIGTTGKGKATDDSASASNNINPVMKFFSSFSSSASKSVVKPPEQEESFGKSAAKKVLSSGSFFTSAASSALSNATSALKSNIGGLNEFVSGIASREGRESFKSGYKWIEIGSKTMIMPGQMVPIEARSVKLLLIATLQGELYCIENSCPHLGTPLETGKVGKEKCNEKNGGGGKIEERDCITCPLHKTKFALESGEVLGQWCPDPIIVGPLLGMLQPRRALERFDTRTSFKKIEVRLPVVRINEAEAGKNEKK